MRMRFNNTILGGGGLALLNHLADKQNPLVTRTIERRPVTNSELVSAAVILGDLLLGEKLTGVKADVLDGAVAGGMYRLMEAVLAPPPAAVTTSYQVPAYQPPAYEAPPAYYEAPPVAAEVPSPAPQPAGVSVLEI